MDPRPDVVDLGDEEESDEASYEPGWYTVLKESAPATPQADTTEVSSTG
jgi:hypothetical protein